MESIKKHIIIFYKVYKNSIMEQLFENHKVSCLNIYYKYTHYLLGYLYNGIELSGQKLCASLSYKSQN